MLAESAPTRASIVSDQIGRHAADDRLMVELAAPRIRPHAPDRRCRRLTRDPLRSELPKPHDHVDGRNAHALPGAGTSNSGQKVPPGDVGQFFRVLAIEVFNAGCPVFRTMSYQSLAS